jgi:hypothetical protein
VFSSPKGRGHDTAARTGSDFSVIFAGRGGSNGPTGPNDRHWHARAPPSRDESPRPIDFSHRLRDEKSLIDLSISIFDFSHRLRDEKSLIDSGCRADMRKSIPNKEICPKGVFELRARARAPSNLMSQRSRNVDELTRAGPLTSRLKSRRVRLKRSGSDPGRS